MLKNINNEIKSMLKTDFPQTDLVILAGGQARRMQGKNKLLMNFDGQIQLEKICQHFRQDVAKIWVNSHRDDEEYQKIDKNIACFTDECTGFLGPLIGMISAWQYTTADYVLFIPCDITQIPTDILQKLHLRLEQSSNSAVVYVQFNQDALYPFCLMKREALQVLKKQMQQQQGSLKQSFQLLGGQALYIEQAENYVHSLNSMDELKQYQQLSSFNLS